VSYFLPVDSGNLFYDKAVGYMSRLPDAAPIREDGIMWIASCTKLITSVCALQCVERGQITLDEPVSKYLPELAAPQIVALDPEAEGGFTLTPAKTAITLRHLLTHTSGNSYEWGDPKLGAWRKAQPPPAPEDAGKMSKLYLTPLLFEPGQGWVYGGSLDWAGEIVGRLNNTTLGGYMEEHVFKPLGMTETTFHLDQRPDLKAKLVLSGLRQKDGSLTANPAPVFSESAVDHSGGGGLWCNATDYIKVLADLIKDEPTLLKRETVVDMLAKPQITVESALAGLVGQRSAAAANAAPASFGMNYGLGGMVLTKASDILPVGTLSWGGLPNLKWFIHPQKQIAALYYTQVMPAGDAKNNALSSEYFKEVIKLVDEAK
jgi:CubicO group peptidase (beta-lactamase class C family)